MKQYNVTGMSCAACSARVEKAVSNVPGVTACSVSLLTNSMGVEGTAADQAIIDAVQAAGYGASVKGAQQSAGPTAGADALADHETPKLRRRLFWSLGFLLVLMYFSMGHMMWGWPLPKFYDGNHVAMGLTQLLLTVIIMVINQKFFISGFQALWHRAPNMDTLVALGATAAFVYSTYALFAMTGAQVRGDEQAVMNYMMDFYFESAAMILTLITVGKTLEARSKGKTTDALRSLMELAPKTATVERDGAEVTVTNEKGIYQLKSAKKWGYVFISVPSGYEVPSVGVLPQFHCALKNSADVVERADFKLEKVDRQDSYKIFMLGDMHLANRTGDLGQFAQFTSDLTDYMTRHKGEKMYALTLGDMTWDLYWYSNSYYFPQYLNTINSQIKNLQIFHTMGNHYNDFQTRSDYDAAVKYVDQICPTYYSFNIGKVHYVVMDDIDCSSYDGTESRNYVKSLSAEQLDWLAKDLARGQDDPRRRCHACAGVLSDHIGIQDRPRSGQHPAAFRHPRRIYRPLRDGAYPQTFQRDARRSDRGRA